MMHVVPKYYSGFSVIFWDLLLFSGNLLIYRGFIN